MIKKVKLIIVCSLIFLFIISLLCFLIDWFDIGIFSSLKGDWLSYFGSIVSSIVSIFGIYWTLRDNRLQQKIEHRREILPYIIYNLKKIETDDDILNNQHSMTFDFSEMIDKEEYSFDKNEPLIIWLEMENVGLGNAIVKDYILNYNGKSLKLMELEEKIINNYLVIKKGEKRKIYLRFLVPNFNDYEIDYMENYSDTYDYSQIDFSIDILLYDLSKNLYKETLEFKINKNTVSSYTSYTLNQEEYYYIYRFNKKNIFPELQESEEV
ncbi:hypothetical protein [Streptococcus oralis]|jgi:hypothetical protein|nr:hypothetical protein [Streptococcus oralis]